MDASIGKSRASEPRSYIISPAAVGHPRRPRRGAVRVAGREMREERGAAKGVDTGQTPPSAMEQRTR